MYIVSAEAGQIEIRSRVDVCWLYILCADVTAMVFDHIDGASVEH